MNAITKSLEGQRMTFEAAAKLAREVMDYYRRLQVIAVGTFGRESGEWGVSVSIDGSKERFKVIWKREDLAAFNGDLVRLCDCGQKRDLHVAVCQCGSTTFEVCQRSYAPTKRSTAVDRKPQQPAPQTGMLF